MKVGGRSFKLAVGFFLALILLLGGGQACFAAIQWTQNGVPVCNDPGMQTDQLIAPDGNGGAIIAWSDIRSGQNRGVYAQRIKQEDGGPLWTSNGVRVSDSSRNQSASGITPYRTADGQHGAVVAMVDHDGSDNKTLYMQRIDENGIARWNLPRGVLIGNLDYDYPNVDIDYDASGNTFIAWSAPGTSSGLCNIRVQKLTSGGNIDWGTNGKLICENANHEKAIPKVAADGSGGAFVMWSDGNVYSTLVTQSRQVLPRVTVCDAAGEQSLGEIISDGQNGAIATWSDARLASDTNIYAMKINSSGACDPRWFSNGVGICQFSGEQISPTLTTNCSGGAVITWADYRHLIFGGVQIYTRVVSAGGIVGWLDNGTQLWAGIQTPYVFPRIASDGSGGAVISCGGGARKIGKLGAPQVPTPIADTVASPPGYYPVPEIVPDAGGGAIIVWMDSRNTGANPNNFDIFAQRVIDSPSLPPCGKGAGSSILVFGVMLGVISLAGSGLVSRRLRG